ncbi:Na(+)-translocating NADH-quinone reductase subunit F [Bizionia myxarmorum]|uniref:Na(+)-translocating NADH-quinone reductase subunit F n=1 Tax=Bizionia myxarmorum TaxID=291186 RepID=A0A5D0RD10_9FLAO|nr:Na(+)-translocating NADH-quinone reductase subunit F [Bizionia myxarmorum]TYB79263.1 Na(+)-translocating NADH-quinone reductase subunit F [Bizionia myxarmorum]
MKNSFRFNQSIEKLYSAFHNNTLNPEDCKQCAVGNIVDNNDLWKHLTDNHGTEKLNYLGSLHQRLGRRFNGYSPLELLQIERSFLIGCGYKITKNNRLLKPEILDNNSLFHGLCSVVIQLCKLDGVKDVMDCTALFNFKIELLDLHT